MFESDKQAKVLVFTRKEGESVVIGDPKNPIGRVQVVFSSPSKVKLSFHFDASIPVNRAEIAAQMLFNDAK